jgi:hypothetical protein
VIPRSVEVLGKSAFSNTKIPELSFEADSQLQQIGKLCFYHCGIRSISIPRSVKVIGKWAFQDAGLETATFEDESELQRIDDGIFCGCSLTSICIPAKVEFVHGSAFLGNAIDTVIGNDRFIVDRELLVDVVDSTAIRYFGHHTEVLIPKEIVVLGPSCFEGAKVESVMFEAESRLTRIDDLCFSECPLNKLCIPSLVESLGRYCFSGGSDRSWRVKMSKAGSLTLENASRLERIEQYSFQFCSIQFLCIPRSVVVLGRSAFEDVVVDILVFESESRLRQIADFCFAGSTLTSICIPKSVEFIGKFCFNAGWGQHTDRSNRIETVTFEPGSQLKRIEESCFSNCPLREIRIPQSVKVLCKACFASARWGHSKVGALIFEADSRLRVMEEACFRQCTLASITIPRSVEVLGKFCFAEAEVQLLAFETDSQLKKVGDGCFQGCSLRSIHLPRSVMSLGKFCFGGALKICDSSLKTRAPGDSFLEVLTLEAGSRLACIDPECFRLCKMLLGVGTEAGPDEVCWGEPAAKSVKSDLEQMIGGLGISVFHVFPTLEHVVVPAAVSVVAELDLYESTSLQSVEFADGGQLREIAGFQRCVALEEIDIPESVQFIAATAFRGCEKLRQVRYGPEAQLREIWGFAECPALRQVDIPGLVEVVTERAFIDSPNIDEVVFASDT